MNVGRELLRSILSTQILRPVLDAGLDRIWATASDSGASAVFLGEDRQAYIWILDHWDKYRKISGIELFRANFPEENIPFEDTGSTLDEIIEEAIRVSQQSIIYSAMSDVVDLYDRGDISKAVEQINSTSHKLNRTFSQQDIAVTVLGDPEFDIEKMLETELEPGIPLGLPSMDEEFYGMQPGQLITLLGRQKAGKSTFVSNSAYQAWAEGWSVLFFSVEMDPEILMQRVYSIGAGVSPERARRGQLYFTERERVRKIHNKFAESIDDVPFRISKKRTLITMDDVISESQQYRPHIVYIDGFYFMRDRITGKTAGPDWQAHENLAAELKTFAASERIPILVTTQVQEKQHDKAKNEIEASSMMGGTGLLRYSDLVLGLNSDFEGTTTASGILSRYTPVSTVKYRVDWNNMEYNILQVGDKDE